jgi:TusA-related sulfurtransferase
MSSIHEVDARNTLCPVPIIRLAAAIKTAALGDIVRVTATDFGFTPDVKAWCKGTKHELVRLEEQGGIITADVRRTK